MDTRGTIVSVNNLNVTGLVPNAQVLNQTIGTDDFMTAFMNAITQGTSAQEIVTEFSEQQLDGTLSQQEILQNPTLEIAQSMIANTKMPEIVDGEEIFSDNEKASRTLLENVDELSSDVANQIITTGNAKDFSAGYLSLISNSENAVDQQAILSSVDTLNGSVAQSLGLMNALETSGISDFLGLLTEDNASTLSATQLLALSNLVGSDSSNDTLLDLLLDESYGSVGTLDNNGLLALLGGFGDYSGQDVLEVLSGTTNVNSVLSAFDDDDDDDNLFSNSLLSSDSILSGLLSGNSYSASDLVSTIFSSSDNDSDMAIPLSSVIPLNALKELANVQQKQQIENLEKLANAFENGEAEVVKTTEYTPITSETVSEDEDLQTKTQAIIEQNSFDNAVREIKKDIQSGDTKKAQTVTLNNVDNTFNGFDVAQDKLGEISKIQRNDVSGTEIAQQTAEKISARLSTGYVQKENFSIKLTPEGLGDVVVSFEKTDGGMVFNISASQSKTAKLLSGEIDTIANALGQVKSFDGENIVVNVSQTQPSQDENFSQQFSDESYQQNSQNFAQSGSHKRNARRNFVQASEAEKVQSLFAGTGTINTVI